MQFNSDRYFTIFDFLISHGQLLLRASKNELYDYNIDIIFFDVHFIQLKTYFKGLSIRKVHDKNAHSYLAMDAYLSQKHSNLFEVESENETFYVAASFIQGYENNLDFNETSIGAIQFKGREKLILEIK